MMQRLRCWMLQPWLLKNTTAEGCGDPKTLGSWETNWAPGASPFSDGDIAPTKSINMWYLRQYFEDQFPTRWRSNRHHDIENYVSWILSCFFFVGSVLNQRLFLFIISPLAGDEGRLRPGLWSRCFSHWARTSGTEGWLNETPYETKCPT